MPPVQAKGEGSIRKSFLAHAHEEMMAVSTSGPHLLPCSSSLCRFGGGPPWWEGPRFGPQIQPLRRQPAPRADAQTRPRTRGGPPSDPLPEARSPSCGSNVCPTTISTLPLPQKRAGPPRRAHDKAADRVTDAEDVRVNRRRCAPGQRSLASRRVLLAVRVRTLRTAATSNLAHRSTVRRVNARLKTSSSSRRTPVIISVARVAGCF